MWKIELNYLTKMSYQINTKMTVNLTINKIIVKMNRWVKIKDFNKKTRRKNLCKEIIILRMNNKKK